MQAVTPSILPKLIYRCIFFFLIFLSFLLPVLRREFYQFSETGKRKITQTTE
jgi:hypothetical protein